MLYVNSYRLLEHRLQLLHKTEVEDVPLGLCEFQVTIARALAKYMYLRRVVRRGGLEYAAVSPHHHHPLKAVLPRAAQGWPPVRIPEPFGCSARNALLIYTPHNRCSGPASVRRGQGSAAVRPRQEKALAQGRDARFPDNGDGYQGERRPHLRLGPHGVPPLRQVSGAEEREAQSKAQSKAQRASTRRRTTQQALQATQARLGVPW